MSFGLLSSGSHFVVVRGPRMSPQVDFASTGLADVSIDLGGDEIGVSQQLLHYAEVGAAIQEMRREGVSKDVWGDRCVDPCLRTGFS